MIEINNRQEDVSIDREETENLPGIQNKMEKPIVNRNPNLNVVDKVANQDVAKGIQEETEPITRQKTSW